MGLLVYVRLIGHTFGTLLQLFWMVVILGYRRQRNFERVLFFFYAACLHLAIRRIPLLMQDPQFNFLVPGSSLGEGFAITLAVALAWCGGWERRFATAAPDKPQRYFHCALLVFFAASFVAVDGLH